MSEVDQFIQKLLARMQRETFRSGYERGQMIHIIADIKEEMGLE